MSNRNPMQYKRRTRWIDTGDGFEPAPPCQQPVTHLHCQILDAVDEYRITSFDAFALDVLVKFSPNQTRDLNTFDFEFGWNSNRNARVRVREHRTTQTLLVLRHRKWIPLTTYLALEADREPTNPNISNHLDPASAVEDRYQHQRRWWRLNKKKFPFQQLPGELREIIYDYCMPQQAIEPYPRVHLRTRLFCRSDYRNKMISNVLRCHPVISREMRSHMFRHLPLLITHPRLLKKTLGDNRFFPRDELTYLKLAFPSHVDYFKFFGFKGSNTNPDVNFYEEVSPSASLLSPIHLPSLERLEIVIPSRDTLSEAAILADGCQTKATHTLLNTMWPYIKYQPLVVSGMIRTWLKDLWEKESAESVQAWKDRLEDQEDGGVPVTQEQIDDMDLWREAYEEWKEESGHMSDSDSSDGSESDDDVDDRNDLANEELWYGIKYGPVMQLPHVCECHPHCLEGEWTCTEEDEEVED